MTKHKIMSNFNTSFNLQKNLLNITVPRIKTIKYSLSHLLSNTVSLEILVRISNFMQITDTHCNSKKSRDFPLFYAFSKIFPDFSRHSLTSSKNCPFSRFSRFCSNPYLRKRISIGRKYNCRGPQAFKSQRYRVRLAV